MVDARRSLDGDDPVSALCSVLADEHCRRVIAYFESADVAVATLEELVEYAVAHDDASTGMERKAIQFHHHALPKLDGAGVIEYDTERREVHYPGHDDLESLLGRLRTVEAGWTDDAGTGGEAPGTDPA